MGILYCNNTVDSRCDLFGSLTLLHEVSYHHHSKVHKEGLVWATLFPPRCFALTSYLTPTMRLVPPRVDGTQCVLSGRRSASIYLDIETFLHCGSSIALLVPWCSAHDGSKAAVPMTVLMKISLKLPCQSHGSRFHERE